MVGFKKGMALVVVMVLCMVFILSAKLPSVSLLPPDVLIQQSVRTESSSGVPEVSVDSIPRTPTSPISETPASSATAAIFGAPVNASVSVVETPIDKKVHKLLLSDNSRSLYLDDARVSTILKSIPVTPRDPTMCNNLLDCTLLFVKRYRNLPEQLGGSIVVATGKGRSYALSYPIERYGGAPPFFIENVLEAALNTSKPTVFLISSMDGDVFHKRHHCKSPEKDPLPLSLDFPFVFFLTPAGTYAAGGRIVVPNSIPIPDGHTIGGGASRDACSKVAFPTEETLVARPSKAIFFGVTTGYSRDFGNGMSYSYTDRFQVVDQLLGSNISQAYFVMLVQGVHLPDDYMGGHVQSATWSKSARYVIDVDGNSNAWSALNWKLCSGGPVIKVNSSSGYVQWYYHLLEHGVHIHLVDVFRQDLEEEVRRVMNDIPYAAKLARNAAEFCCKYLRSEVQVQYLRTTVATLWETPELLTRDWRIKSPPNSRLRPMTSPYVRYGPMKRIQQALAIGGEVSADRGVPTALLNLARVVDIRTVCVLGSVFPASLGKQVWSALFDKRLHFAPNNMPATCDMVVRLEDALFISVDDVMSVVSKEYHIIVSLGALAANTTALRKSETVVGEWPSVYGVVTQMQSVLKYPDNYIQEPYFPCI